MSKDYKEEQRKSREALAPKRNEELSKPPSYRKVMRQKVVDRKMTKRGYEYGLKIGSRDYNLVHAMVNRQKDPNA